MGITLPGMTSPVACWRVPDIEAKLAEATAAGATVKEPAHDVGGGRLPAMSQSMELVVTESRNGGNRP